MKKFNFKGLMAPVFTGFTEDSKLNTNIITEYAGYLAKNNVKGILVNGTTGEGISMSTEERKSNLEAWMSEIKKQKYDFVTMVQVGGTAFVEVEKLAQHAESIGVDSILCLPELFFYPANEDILVDYLDDVSKAAPQTPLFYYHIPMFTRINFDMESFVKKCKSKIKTFAGIKFTHTNLEELQRTIKAGGEDIHCFLGSDQLVLGGFVYGCYSQIATMINIRPDLMTAILNHVQNGNLEEAKKVQNELTELTIAISKHGSWVATMKTAMFYKTGLDVIYPRKPLRELKLNQDDLIKQLFS